MYTKELAAGMSCTSKVNVNYDVESDINILYYMYVMNDWN